jgi:hypothetical protein
VGRKEASRAFLVSVPGNDERRRRAVLTRTKPHLSIRWRAPTRRLTLRIPPHSGCKVHFLYLVLYLARNLRGFAMLSAHNAGGDKPGGFRRASVRFLRRLQPRCEAPQWVTAGQVTCVCRVTLRCHQ